MANPIPAFSTEPDFVENEVIVFKIIDLKFFFEILLETPIRNVVLSVFSHCFQTMDILIFNSRNLFFSVPLKCKHFFLLI